MKEVVKDQHFLPKFYLKLFADNHSNLRALNLESNLIGKSKHYSSFGYEYYFYAKETGVPDNISQDIESWLGYFENIISKPLPSIIKKILGTEHINVDDKYILSALMCMLWLRTPAMREQLGQIEKRLSKSLDEFNKRKNVNQYNRKANSNLGHLRFMMTTFGFDDAGFTNMFFGHNWRVYIAKGKQKFITSDNPVVELFLPPKHFYDNSFFDRKKYFSLTPDILFELDSQIGLAKIKRQTLFDSDIDKIKHFNLIIANNSMKCIYSNDKEVLEELAEKRMSPGKLELDYFIKYQKPWIEFEQKNKNN
jgi:hypothetical protein